MGPKNDDASGRFKDVSAVGVRIIINKAGDSLLRQELHGFLQTWQKNDAYGSSILGQTSEGFQYMFFCFIPPNVRDHIIMESVTQGCKSFQEKKSFSLTIEIQVFHLYPA
jgi:hypothetical protein